VHPEGLPLNGCSYIVEDDLNTISLKTRRTLLCRFFLLPIWVPLWLDPKGRDERGHLRWPATHGVKDQGSEEIGYLRAISANIFETHSPDSRRDRSNSEDVEPLRFCSGRAADSFKAGVLRICL